MYATTTNIFFCGFWGLNWRPHAYIALPPEVFYPFILLSWFIFNLYCKVSANWDIDEDAGHWNILLKVGLRPYIWEGSTIPYRELNVDTYVKEQQWGQQLTQGKEMTPLFLSNRLVCMTDEIFKTKTL